MGCLTARMLSESGWLLGCPLSDTADESVWNRKGIVPQQKAPEPNVEPNVEPKL